MLACVDVSGFMTACTLYIIFKLLATQVPRILIYMIIVFHLLNLYMRYLEFKLQDICMPQLPKLMQDCLYPALNVKFVPFSIII